MKRIIFYIISLTSILNAQNGLTQQEINDFYITPLDSTDNLQSTIEGIINLNLVEALPKIEENFWKQSCMNQEWFLEAMFKFNSKLTHDYCLRYLDSINNSTSKKYKYYMCGDTLSTKVEVK